MNYYDWPKIVSQKTNEELVSIIKNKSSEPADKIIAALNELKNRGIGVDNYETILAGILKTKPILDENSPTLYSDKVIYTFSVLFSVIFGGVLFALNLKAINNKKGTQQVIIFSILFTAFSIFILNLINIGSVGTIILGGIGAVIINNYFWNKYIGKGILYHRKSFLKPLIIALIIFTPLVALLIWAKIVIGQ